MALFRDGKGAVHCLSDVRVHRGRALSGGWTTERDCVACPYHGWEFDPDGKVQFTPSRGEGGEVPERARIDAYPAQERYGMIWVWGTWSQLLSIPAGEYGCHHRRGPH